MSASAASGTIPISVPAHFHIIVVRNWVIYFQIGVDYPSKDDSQHKDCIEFKYSHVRTRLFLWWLVQRG